MKPHDKNFGIHPLSPEYDDSFDYQEILDDYEAMAELDRDERLFQTL